MPGDRTSAALRVGVRSAGSSAERGPNVADRRAISGPAASIDPVQPACGVQHHVTAELIRVVADASETSPVTQGTRQSDPGPGVDDREPPRPSPEPEHPIGGASRVTQDRDVQVESAFEDRDRRRRCEGDADDTAIQGVALCSDLHEVLIARDSAEVTHEDEHHRLAAELRQTDLAPAGRGEGQVRDGLSGRHGSDTADHRAGSQADTRLATRPAGCDVLTAWGLRSADASVRASRITRRQSRVARYVRLISRPVVARSPSHPSSTSSTRAPAADRHASTCWRGTQFMRMGWSPSLR